MLLKLAIVGTLLVVGCVAPPVDEKKKKAEEHEEPNDIDSQAFQVEYKRYLEEVVQALENDEEFRNRLLKAKPEDVQSGHIAKELEYASHHVRSKLDELKRQEMERLRQAAVKQYELANGIDTKHMKMPGHVDHQNPYTFEIEDLKKLITHTAKEIDEADKQRKNEFKEYEMQKELEYQEQLKHMDEKNKAEAEKFHDGQVKKHKEHGKLHHPGSEDQLKEVWQEQDHLDPEDFNPKTFFRLHDLDGNGVWDANEVKALFRKELDKMYDPNMPEDDIKERYEEMERMREHVFQESDTNRDNLISFEEFIAQTQRREFKEDDGWKGLDEENQYSQDEYQTYAKQHEEEVRRMYEQGLIPPAPPGYVPMVVPPGHQMPPGHHNQPVYHVPPQGAHPNEINHGQNAYHPQQGQYQQHPNAAIPAPGSHQQPGMHPMGNNQYPPHPQQPNGYQQHPQAGYQQPGGYQQPHYDQQGHQNPGGYQQQPHYDQQGHQNPGQMHQQGYAPAPGQADYHGQPPAGQGHPQPPPSHVESNPNGHNNPAQPQSGGSSHPEVHNQGAAHQVNTNSGGTAQNAPPAPNQPQGANAQAQQQSH